MEPIIFGHVALRCRQVLMDMASRDYSSAGGKEKAGKSRKSRLCYFADATNSMEPTTPRVTLDSRISQTERSPHRGHIHGERIRGQAMVLPPFDLRAVRLDGDEVPHAGDAHTSVCA